MTGVFAHLSPGEPGLRTDKGVPEDATTIDVPVIGTPERSGCCRALCNADRSAVRKRLRVAQLLMTIGALATIRPLYGDGMQWTTLLVLCHTLVISFVLLWDRHTGGRVVRSQLPLVDWRLLELQYTAITTVILYVLTYGVMFAFKGYTGFYVCNWVSCCLTLLITLAYGAETWLQLRDKYGGHTAISQ